MANERNVWLELGVTIGAPTAVLWGLSERLGAAPALALALSFPTVWIVAGIVRSRKLDKLALLALFGIGVTGGVGLLELDARWVALKELLIPGLFAAAFLGSTLTASPAVAPILEQVLDAEATGAALAAKGAGPAWQAEIRRTTVALGLVMLGSGLANAALTWWMLDAPPGTPEFNADLGRINTAGLVAVTVPTMGVSVWVLQRLLQRLEALTGVSVDDLMPGAGRPG